MARYGVAEAKDGLPSLIDKALAGEEVVITRHGRPVVELRAIEPAAPKRSRAEIFAKLAELRARVGPLEVDSLEIIRQDREEAQH